jgi:hypothetical protein
MVRLGEARPALLLAEHLEGVYELTRPERAAGLAGRRDF